MNRSIPTAGVVLATAAVLSVGLASPASADIASPSASCPGLALSEHAVIDGPRAISSSVAALREFLESSGRSSGSVISRWAAVHAGTHVPGCEQALYAALTSP